MTNVLNAISEIQSVIEEATFEELTKDQLSKMNDNFNTYFRNMEVADTDIYIMFNMSKRDFKNFEYYCGMEYAKDEIEYKLETTDSVLVVYGSGCERACELISRITGKDIGELDED